VRQHHTMQQQVVGKVGIWRKHNLPAAAAAE
jgi:hypothetical protein